MTANYNNPIQKLLIQLGFFDAANPEQIADCVRDRDDIQVLRCTKSGIIFLSRFADKTAVGHQNRKDFSYWNAADRMQAVKECHVDDSRRASMIRNDVCGRLWLDVGTGAGGILDLLIHEAGRASAVEMQKAPREALRADGYEIYSEIAEVPRGQFQVVTLFHVLEHFADPLSALKLIRERMSGGAKLIVEVPHARDALLALYDVASFKKHTFWSEHYVLHTRESLKLLIEAAGFVDVGVKGIQRYPLANHAHWMARGAPGGHKAWDCLRDEDLDHTYERVLSKIDMTDTLWAEAVNPHS